jgi:hypothetical protein
MTISNPFLTMNTLFLTRNDSFLTRNKPFPRTNAAGGSRANRELPLPIAFVRKSTTD